MDGGNDSMLSPIKTTSLTFNFILDSANIAGTTSTSIQREIIDDVLATAANSEGELSVLIEKGNSDTGTYRRWWIGVLLGDLSSLNDKGIGEIITLKAVDGLTQLKYKSFDQSIYGGQRSLLYLIKSGLNLITCNHTDFNFWDDTSDEKKRFIGHTPFYYNRVMATTLDNTWKRDINHDPLALLKLSTILFNNNDGTSWSWYKVIEQILASMQLRISIGPITDMLTTASPAEVYNGNCMWYIQSPLINHLAGDNSNKDLLNLIFYHNKNTTSDIAIEYDQFFGCYHSNPTQKLSGSKENFIAPLGSFKSIYSHNILSTKLGNSQSYSSFQSANSSQYNTFGTGADLPDGIELTGKTDTPPPGWPCGTDLTTCKSVAIAEQRIIIRGNIQIIPVDTMFYNNGVGGYESGKEFWEANGETWALYNFFNLASNEDIIMPRLGVGFQTIYKNITSDTTENGIFWMGDERFSILSGSVGWSEKYNAWPIGDMWGETNNYPNNYAGYDGTFLGTKYDSSNVAGSTYQDTNGQILWGTDIGESNFYWWGDPDNQGGFTNGDDYLYQQYPYNNAYAYCSPYYYESDINILAPTSGWSSSGWSNASAEVGMTSDFVIESPRLPMLKGASDLTTGSNYFKKVMLYWNPGRDNVFGGFNNSTLGSCRGWNNNKELLSENRGVTWAFNYTDVSVYILATGVGSGMYADSSVGSYINTGNNPSEQLISDPELTIGGVPEKNLSGDNVGSDTYPGQLSIYTTADSINEAVGTITSNWINGEAVFYNTIWDWRAIYESDSDTNDLKLFNKRAKQGLSHYPQMKRGLELNLMDRTIKRTIEKAPFSSIYYWTSGEWEQNQSGADIGYIVTGGTFTAGTGKLKLVLEDATTFNRSIAEDVSYITIGNQQVLIASTTD